MPPKFSRGQAESREVEVSGFTFRIGILEPMEALSLEHALKGALLPAVSSALGGGSVSTLLDMEGEALGGMLGKLSEGISEALTRRVFEALCRVSQAQDDTGQFFDLSNKIVCDMVFKGAPLLVYRFIWEALKVNYSDFLAGFQSADLASLMAAAKTKGSPSVSSGAGQ